MRRNVLSTTSVVSNIFECYNECVLEDERFGGGSVMMWAWISHDGRTTLMRVNGAFNAQIYQDEILQRHVVPLIIVSGGIWQHDNTRPHTARVCRDFLQQNNVQTYPQ